MSTEENKAIVRRLIEEGINQRDLALFDELYAPDFLYHLALTTIEGVEAYKQFNLMSFTAFPDLRFTIEDQIAEGDKVVSRWLVSGTHKGPFQGIPPTGKQVTVTGVGINRFANGKIVENWTNMDFLGILQQLGVVPVPGQAR
jgi:steroid delta-isomerase-like uncharacterized protein